MYLRYLRVRRFRNLAPIDVSLEPGAHVLLGRNGEGKTNFLEAIFCLLTGTSFRNAPLRDLVQWNQPNFFLGGRVSSGHGASQTIKSSYSTVSAQRRILIDEQRSSLTRLQELAGIVFLSHEDLGLVAGSPSLRRSWADRLIVQTDSGVSGLTYRYFRAVRQRNQVLQQAGGRPNHALVHSWTDPWLKLGASLMKRHAELVQNLNPRAAEYYRCLAAQDPPFRLEYVPGLGQEPDMIPGASDEESNWLKALETALVESEPIEARRGYTVVGPHTDEIAMFLGDAPIQRFGSQGQQRTAALALRLAEIDLLRSISAREPVILADEIFGELDEDRRAMVWEHLCRVEQLWLTAAKGSGLEQFGPFQRRFIVESGVLL